MGFFSSLQWMWSRVNLVFTSLSQSIKLSLCYHYILNIVMKTKTHNWKMIKIWLFCSQRILCPVFQLWFPVTKGHMFALQGQLWKMLILSCGKGNPKLCGFIFKSLLLVLIELFALVWVELCNSQTEIS